MSRLPSLGPRGEGWVAIQGAILAAVAVAGLAGPAWSDPVRVPIAGVGFALAAAGGLLAVRGLVDLADALTPLPHPRADASLVEHGAYRLVRHPIYGGLVLGALGYGLVTASWLAIAGAAVLLVFFRLKSAREEAWLERHYAGYAAYRGRTRRLIPWVY
jgi:protein-S-isoprenylcysteine O-methyltransferase Ste14